MLIAYRRNCSARGGGSFRILATIAGFEPAVLDFPVKEIYNCITLPTLTKEEGDENNAVLLGGPAKFTRK